MKNTNNLPLLDQQPWDENVKAVAKVPLALKKMDEISPGPFNWGGVCQPTNGTNDRHSGPSRQSAGERPAQNYAEQVVVVTNTVVERTYEQQVVYVTNTVVQIQPSNPRWCMSLNIADGGLCLLPTAADPLVR